MNKTLTLVFGGGVYADGTGCIMNAENARLCEEQGIPVKDSDIVPTACPLLRSLLIHANDSFGWTNEQRTKVLTPWIGHIANTKNPAKERERAEILTMMSFEDAAKFLEMNNEQHAGEIRSFKHKKLEDVIQRTLQICKECNETLPKFPCADFYDFVTLLQFVMDYEPVDLHKTGKYIVKTNQMVYGHSLRQFPRMPYDFVANSKELLQRIATVYGIVI